MNDLLPSFILSITLAFFMGFAIRSGNICAVAAVNQWISHQNPTHLRAFITAIAAAGAVLLPSCWLFEASVSLSPAYPTSALTFCAGALFGYGSFLNGACVFGTLTHLSSGQTDYFGTIVGMIFGSILGPFIFTMTILGQPDTSLSRPNFIAITIWLFYLIILIYETFSYQTGNNRHTFFPATIKHWTPFISMLMVGVTGGLLHAIIGDWGYLTVLSGGIERLIDPTLPALKIQVLACTVALIAGAVIAARRVRYFHILPPRLPIMLRKLVGGTLMGLAAAAIPGGNETLLLHGVPSLASHAIIAYAGIVTALALLFKRKHSRSVPIL